MERSDQLGRTMMCTGEEGDKRLSKRGFGGTFHDQVFKMKDGVLMFTKAANRNRIREVLRICLPESLVKKVWSLCH